MTKKRRRSALEAVFIGHGEERSREPRSEPAIPAPNPEDYRIALESVVGITMDTLAGNSPQEVLAKLDKLNPEALLLEPRSVYDTALVDVTDDPQDQWPRPDKVWIAVYDEQKCVEAIKIWMDCSDEDAWDWFSFNTSGAWVGEGTPTFRHREDKND
jgi:hypothetical protein